MKTIRKLENRKISYEEDKRKTKLLEIEARRQYMAESKEYPVETTLKVFNKDLLTQCKKLQFRE